MALKSAVLEVELAVSRAMYTGVPGKHVCVEEATWTQARA